MSKMQHNCKRNEGIDESLVGGVSGKRIPLFPKSIVGEIILPHRGKDWENYVLFFQTSFLDIF